MKFIVQQKHIDFLEKNRIYTNGAGDYSIGWLKIGAYLGFAPNLLLEPYSGHYAGPYFSSLGSFSYSKSVLPPGVLIGRYCAIGSKATVMPVDHPMDRVSICGFDYASYAIWSQLEKDENAEIKKIKHGGHGAFPVIGNDVWIGHDCVFKRGVKIGDGAVIGTRSIVTKDVPPYAIVAGAPAIVRKYRFSEKIIERFMNLQWWKYKFTAFAGMDTGQPEKFLDSLEELLVAGKIYEFPERRINLGQSLLEA